MPEETKTKPDETPVSFKLDPALVRDIDEISERESRSRSGTVRLALLTFVRNYKSEAQKRNRRRANS